ncbi:MAG: type II secretion system F family protein [Planctomycetes bacterium]|nr:type II secretion system F family protein [Planctomycetota bacterium]
MAVFAVRVAKPGGGIETARIEAATSDAAAAAAMARGLTPLSVSAAKPEAAPRSSAKKRKLATRVARELSVLTAAGLSVEPALAALAKHATDDDLKEIADGLLEDVRGGAALSEAFAARPDTFPAPFPEIAEAGEAGGALGRALGELADTRERREQVEAGIQGAMIYPAFLLVAAVGAVTLILIFLVPQFENTFAQIGAQIPPQAAFVFGISHWLKTWGLWLLAGLVVLIFAIAVAMRQPALHERMDRWMLRAPFVGGATKTVIAARFCRERGLLLRNGLSAAPALRLAARAAGNQWAVARLTEALAQVRTGRGFSDQVEASDVLPPLAAELLSVGEETGDLGSAADRLADFYEARFERNAKAISRIVEPAVIMIAGLVIGGVILSILSALMSINTLNF